MAYRSCVDIIDIQQFDAISAPVDATVPTIGFKCETLSMDGHTVTIYDLGGGERIRNIWRNYFPDIHGVIYVVDSSQMDRVSEARLALTNTIGNPLIVGKPCLMYVTSTEPKKIATLH